MEAMGLTSKGLERSQAARKGERFGFRKGMALRTVRTLLTGRLLTIVIILYSTVPLTLLLSPGELAVWAQGGYFTYETEVNGTDRYLARVCDLVVHDITSPWRGSGPGGGTGWGTRLSATHGEAWRRGTVKFIIYWHGEQAPDPYVVLGYFEDAFLNVTTPRTHGSATSSFRGNVSSGSVSLQGGCEPRDLSLPPCHASRQIFGADTRPYYVSFTQVRDGLWKAELSVPFQVEVNIVGSCPPPPLGVSSGYIEAGASVAIVDTKFVYIVAENEPSYHKKDECVAEMNTLSGRLDDRQGDTVIELYGDRQYVPPQGPGGQPYLYTDWYLGNRMVYTRVLHGNWCAGDCPLNEWWLCGAYYKDNLFHEFTSVNAVIGFPKSDCEEWYIGTEKGWNDLPSVEFWGSEDVQRRVASVLGQLPFKYEVELKVTDDYGDGFSDRANYTMTIHAPLENYTPVGTEYVYLPQRVGDAVRPGPTYFIDEPAWGATPLLTAANYTDLEQEIVERVNASDTYTLSTTISGECSAGIEGPLTIKMSGLQRLRLKQKLELQGQYPRPAAMR